jgi:hypothetical protein
MLIDVELAELYGVPTKALNQAVKRNIERFPEDFMFRLSGAEAEAVNRSQSVTGSQSMTNPRRTRCYLLCFSHLFDLVKARD